MNIILILIGIFVFAIMVAGMFSLTLIVIGKFFSILRGLYILLSDMTKINKARLGGKTRLALYLIIGMGLFGWFVVWLL